MAVEAGVEDEFEAGRAGAFVVRLPAAGVWAIASPGRGVALGQPEEDLVHLVFAEFIGDAFAPGSPPAELHEVGRETEGPTLPVTWI